METGMTTQNTAIVAQRSAQELQANIAMAKRFPRDESAQAEKMVKAFERLGLAEKATYAFPRGKKQDANGNWVENIISGPSINLARECARLWGNIIVTPTIVERSGENITIEVTAHDLETNTVKRFPATFKALVQRKVWTTEKNGKKTSETKWVEPDERDLRELVNKQISLCERSAILSLIPSDIIEECLSQVSRTKLQALRGTENVEGEKIVKAFEKFDVSLNQLEKFLETPKNKWSAEHVQALRDVYASLRDGEMDVQDIPAFADRLALAKESASETVLPPAPPSKHRYNLTSLDGADLTLAFNILADLETAGVKVDYGKAQKDKLGIVLVECDVQQFAEFEMK